MTQQKKPGLETLCGLIAAILAVLGLGLYILGFSTGYYIFGQMQSTLTVILICAAIVLLVFNNIARRKWTDAVWTKVLTFGATALLAAGALYIVGDRVEGIGNCIVTDYDSGHGGEEAIYLSLGGAVLLLIAMVFNIVGAFSKERAADAKPQTVKKIVTSVIAAALAVAVGLTALNLGGVLGGKAGPGGAGLEGTYTISFNQNNNNVENMPGYQFLCSDLSGMLKADSRFFIDEKLELKGGAYTLTSDAYVVEGGKRAEIGDDTGLGLILTTVATGTYTDNGDGTITTSAAEHAVFTMQTDTYSQQMKGAAQMNVGGNDADGVYDSNDEPAVLDFVPETVWTLDGSAIVTYEAEGEEEEPTEPSEPAEAQSLIVTSDDGGTTLTFNPDGTYAFDFEAYGIHEEGTWTYEGGVLTVTNGNGDAATADGDPMHLHYVSATSDQLTGDYTIAAADLAALLSGGAGSGESLPVTSDDGGTVLTFNPDGTYAFDFEAYGIHEEGTWTYEGGVLTVTNGNGDAATADGDPMHLHYVSATSDQLTGDYTIAAADLAAVLGGEAAQGEPVVITADDGATTLTFNPDGTFTFFFEAYGVEESGTWSYENGVLTVTNPNGDAVTAEGDPMALHYVTAVSDQLAGDYTIPVSELEKTRSATPAGAEVTSDDGATVLTFNPDGTFAFDFAAYGVHEEGTWSYENGVLTVTNPNGDAVTAEGDPMALHYVTAMSDQLAGDYTIPASLLAG